jgi:Flp pilus assembly pilin Flp
MLYSLFGYAHARAHLVWRDAGHAARRRLRGAADEHGQGTVEYVGLILLVSLLMVGMVAAMKGFNGKQGTELADVIVEKIKSAVDAISFQ